MRRYVLLLAFALPVPAVAQDAPKPDVAKLSSWLTSVKREERFAAIAIVESLSVVPGDLAEPLLALVRREAEYSLSAPETKGPGHDIKSLSLTGEEVSLVRLKGNPEDYIGKDFILCGGVATDNYFNFGYSEASQTHYSFRFFQVDKDMRVTSNDMAHVYLPKSIGKGFAERVTQVMEGGANAMVVRLRCRVDPRRIGSDHDQILSHIGIVDWAYANPEGGWKPWAFDGMTRGFAQLKRIGVPAVGGLAAIILSDQVILNEGTDEMLRTGAGVTLVGMDVDARRAAKAILQRGAAKAKTREAKEYGRVTIETLAKSDFEGHSMPTPKPVDAAVRVATALRSAQNLERAKKPAGALNLYRQIVKDYPNSEEAKVAAGRIAALGGK